MKIDLTRTDVFDIMDGLGFLSEKLNEHGASSENTQALARKFLEMLRQWEEHPKVPAEAYSKAREWDDEVPF